jgi:uncharacterized OB-fold protein
MTQTTTPTVQGPVRDSETATFWDAARDGKLLIKRCDACAEPFFYPRSRCPFCLSTSSWELSSGKGVIYSLSAVHLRSEQYVLAFVTLNEGPTMMTNILADDPAGLAIGDPVSVRFVEADNGEYVPMFERA